MGIVAHGVCSSGIFSCANMIYERTHSRIIIINKRNLNYFPSLSIFWFLLCIANFGGPFTYNLLGEIILIIRLRDLSYYILIPVLFLSFQLLTVSFFTQICNKGSIIIYL